MKGSSLANELIGLSVSREQRKSKSESGLVSLPATCGVTLVKKSGQAGEAKEAFGPGKGSTSEPRSIWKAKLPARAPADVSAELHAIGVKRLVQHWLIGTVAIY